MESCKRVNLCALGGGGEVGANCFELSFGGRQILLDCGTHPKKEGECSLPAFDLLTRAPEAYIITHGHVDHIGGNAEMQKATGAKIVVHGDDAIMLTSTPAMMLKMFGAKANQSISRTK